MDTILEEQPDGSFVVISEDEFEFFTPSDDGNYIVEKASLWIIDGEICRPSPSLLIQKKLNPGVYQVELTRDYGLYCKKLKVESDKLFKFSDSVIAPLLSEIGKFWKKGDLYKQNNLLHKRGILLEGLPGNGKTSIISLLADQVIKSGGLVFIVPNANNLGIYIDFIKNNLRQIEPERELITIIEDIDKFTHSDMLLDFLDGKTNIEHHVIIATTNNTEDLPDSYLRPSRIDLRIEVLLPNEAVRREYFVFKGVPEDQLDELVKISENLSIADLKELYISVFLLDYTPQKALEKVKKPRTKINYNKSALKKPIGL